MYLKNSVALITGGAQGLGKGFARAVLEAGGKVSLLDVKEDVGRKTADEFSSRFGPGTTVFLKCDVCNQQDVEAAFKQTYDKFGKLDLVVNNAGISTFGGNWQRTIDINLTGVMRCCFLAADYMRRSKQGGHIVNIASAAGLFSVPYDPAYVASKHGVVGLSRCLSELWEPQSIRVSCLCPTYADTELVKIGQESTDQGFSASVKILGIMSVEQVVQAFEQLLKESESTGGVLLVNPHGARYKYGPRVMKNSSKL